MIYCFYNDQATTEIYTYCHTLSLHDALPISSYVLSLLWPPLKARDPATSSPSASLSSSSADDGSSPPVFVLTRGSGEIFSPPRSACAPTGTLNTNATPSSDAQRAPGTTTREIGRAHVRTLVTHAHLVCRLLLVKQQSSTHRLIPILDQA